MFFIFMPMVKTVILASAIQALGGQPQTKAPGQAQHQGNYHRPIFFTQPSARSASMDIESRSDSVNPGSQTTLTLGLPFPQLPG